MDKEKKLRIGRYLLLVVFALGICLALMLWKEVGYNSIVMIYALPLGLYIPVISLIALFKTFERTLIMP